jgi:hypothetical protein
VASANLPAGEALHDGLEARGVGSDELGLELSIQVTVTPLADRARAVSRLLTVYQSPRAAGSLLDLFSDDFSSTKSG